MVSMMVAIWPPKNISNHPWVCEQNADRLMHWLFPPPQFLLASLSRRLSRIDDRRLAEGHGLERSERDLQTVNFNASLCKHGGSWVFAGGCVLITDLTKQNTPGSVCLYFKSQGYGILLDSEECVCVYTHVCDMVYLCMCMHACMYVCTCVHMCVCMNACVYMCVLVLTQDLAT